MRKTPTKGRQAWYALAIVAVAVVGLSGCIDASGLEVAGMDSASAGASNLQTTPDDATAETPAEEEPPNGEEPAGGSNQVEADGGATEAATTEGSQATTPPPTTAEQATTTTTAGSASESDGGAQSSGGGSSAGASSSGDQSASEPADEPEGPQRGEVVTGDSVQVQSHDIKDYPDGLASVGGTLMNPTDDSLDGVRVTVVLYDESGSVLGERTTSTGGLEPGGTATYSTTFEDVDYLDVDRYRVEATAVETGAETPTSTPTPTSNETEAASDDGEAASDDDGSAPEPAVEPEGPQRGDVTSDESTRVLSHDIKDYPDGNANVGGTLENPTERTLEAVRVTVVVFDDAGARLGERTTEIVDLAPGGTATYAVEFEDIPYSDVARYEVTSTAAGSTEPAEPSEEATGGSASELPEPEGPQRGQVESDASTHVVSHDIKDYPDGLASVGGTLMNPTDEDIEHVHVNVRVYDEADVEIGNETVCVQDVPAAGNEGYSVTFASVNYTDVDRYEVESFVSDE